MNTTTCRKFARTAVIGLALAFMASAITQGCSATHGGAQPQLSPADQCLLIETAATAAETGVAFAKIKDPTALAAVQAALHGVQAAAADYCAQVAAGSQPEALGTFLVAFNTAMHDFNQAKMAASIAGT